MSHANEHIFSRSRFLRGGALAGGLPSPISLDDAAGLLDALIADADPPA